MAKMIEYTIIVQKELERITKIQARNVDEALKNADIKVVRGSGKPGRPRKE